MAAKKWSVALQRPDGKAGEDNIQVTAATADEAVELAYAKVDPGFTEVVSVTQL